MIAPDGAVLALPLDRLDTVYSGDVAREEVHRVTSDQRLSRLERSYERLERRLWLMSCGLGASVAAGSAAALIAAASW